jgi:DNA-directed RNA polymerase specialized sigma24 family protein
MTDEDREFVDFFADEYWPLRRLGFLLTGNWHEADELAQEATARTFAAWGRCGGAALPQRTPAGWLPTRRCWSSVG